MLPVADNASGRRDQLQRNYISGVIGSLFRMEQDVLPAVPIELPDVLDRER